MFTKKELEAFRLKLRGLLNREIAESMGVSESDISQTLSRLRRKITTVQDSVELLTKMGVIREGPKYVLTERGRALAEKMVKTTSTSWLERPFGKHLQVAWLGLSDTRFGLARTKPVSFCIYGEKKVGYELSRLHVEEEKHFSSRRLISNIEGVIET